VERLHAFMRSASGRRVGSEKKKLEDAGTEVVLIQPTAEDLEVMGGNLMSSERRHEVLELARRTVAEQLRRPELQRALADLPAGDPERIRKPTGPPSTWPRPDWVAERQSSAA
jgi:NTE family protein